ncbi:hypothetical protein F6455_13730 [Proteobacteria bacterium 005FR1]|nr:hypothetical protein [Proteobacteria bacterium 005FR1]
MICKFLLAIGLSVSVASATAMETIAIDYEYAGAHDVDFSTIPRGPLKIAGFEDSRAVNNPHLIAVSDQQYQTEQPVADLIRSAFVQGIKSGGGTLAESGEKLVLTGELTELDATRQNGEIQVTVRSKVKLQKSSGSDLYNTTAFGRAAVPESEGLQAALSASLDKMVNSLLWDDYFLMQVID